MEKEILEYKRVTHRIIWNCLDCYQREYEEQRVVAPADNIGRYDTSATSCCSYCGSSESEGDDLESRVSDFIAENLRECYEYLQNIPLTAFWMMHDYCNSRAVQINIKEDDVSEIVRHIRLVKHAIYQQHAEKLVELIESAETRDGEIQLSFTKSK